MNRKLMLACFAAVAFSSTGCLEEVGKAADALDRFSIQIDKTTKEGGDLYRLVDKTSAELREVIKDAKQSGKEITADFMFRWAEERKETFEQIRKLSNTVFKDSHVLIRHLQVAGLSSPLQLGNELKGFSADIREEMARSLAMIPMATDPKTLTGYSGLTWSERASGYYQVTFQIKDAARLKISVGGGDPIEPAKTPTGSEVTFRIPNTPSVRMRFDDRHDKVVGFALVDADQKTPAKDWRVRCSGWILLQPRFPVEYSLRVISPGAGAGGESRIIDQGSAINELILSTPGSGHSRAARHGAIYRAARTRLPVGPSRVMIPKQATWSLTVKFPDGKSEVLCDGKLRVTNDFGLVTVTPNLTEGTWTLLIDVEPK